MKNFFHNNYNNFCEWFNLIFSGVDRKKSVRLNTEFNRSVSVPVDKVLPRLPGCSAPNQTPTTPESEYVLIKETALCMLPNHNYRMSAKNRDKNLTFV